MKTLENNVIYIVDSLGENYNIGYTEDGGSFQKKNIVVSKLSAPDLATYNGYKAILPNGTIRNVMQIAPSQSGGTERYLSFNGGINPIITDVSSLSPSDKAKYDAYKSLITSQLNS
jgi:hypothetical protein